MILIERKIAAWIQDRVGPNRSGPRGILQPFCDGIKLLFKEEYTPDGVDKTLFVLAPALLMGLALASIAVIPFGGQLEIWGKTIHLQIAHVDIGVLYLLALSSLSVYGVVLGGWASNNKYSLLGSLRAAAQILSYEVPLVLSLLSMVMLTGTLRLEKIVDIQIQQGWFILSQPLTFLIFLVCIFAETNRLPFDLPECEQELVAGYHTEYASMKFGCFFLGEYAHIIVSSSLAVVLFFGGWHLPGLTSESPTIGAALLRVIIFLIKVWAFIFFYMWVRWTLPRFRFDKVMKLAWQSLVPLALLLLISNTLVVYFTGGQAHPSYWGQLIGNIIVFVILLVIVGLTPDRTGEGNMPITFYQTERNTSNLD